MSPKTDLSGIRRRKRVHALAIAALLACACDGGDEATVAGAKGPAAAPAATASDAKGAEVNAPEVKTDPVAGLHAAASASAVASLVKDGSTRTQLSRALKPEAADYVAVFGADYGPALEKRLARAWGADKVQPGPWGPEQAEILTARATSEEFQSKALAAKDFPRGYAKVQTYMQPGVTFELFRYVRPGEKAGASYDALVRVGEHWRFFPQPWIAAEAGSEFYVPNPAEALCADIKLAGITGIAEPAACVHDMSKRAEDLGAEGFEAYAKCVRALDKGGDLSSCTPRAAD